MRNKKRATMTDEARRLIILDIERLKTEGHNPLDVLNQSIKRGWTGVFPIKPGNEPSRYKPKETRSNVATL